MRVEVHLGEVRQPDGGIRPFNFFHKSCQAQVYACGLLLTDRYREMGSPWSMMERRRYNRLLNGEPVKGLTVRLLENDFIAAGEIARVDQALRALRYFLTAKHLAAHRTALETGLCNDVAFEWEDGQA